MEGRAARRGGSGAVRFGVVLLVSAAGCLRAEPAHAVQAMGSYEVVPDWPRPLPDEFPGEHDGWTWGSGAFAESADKVWVAQRAEIELPPGAETWI